MQPSVPTKSVSEKVDQIALTSILEERAIPFCCGLYFDSAQYFYALYRHKTASEIMAVINPVDTNVLEAISCRVFNLVS